LAGFVTMFALTWPIDLWAAASHGWVVTPPSILPLLVGYGFVVAAVVVTGVLDGRDGVRALLRRFLVWRVGVQWYLVVLLGPVVIYLAAVALHLALTASLVVGIVWALWHLPKRLAEGGPAHPLWLFLLETTAKGVLFTWVFNGTGGSLLTVTLFHSAVNTSTVFLPIVPTGDTFRPYAFSVGLFCLAAVTVIVLTRGRLLSRQPDGPLEVCPTQPGLPAAGRAGR
jgi:hypothetical protein